MKLHSQVPVILVMLAAALIGCGAPAPVTPSPTAAPTEPAASAPTAAGVPEIGGQLAYVKKEGGVSQIIVMSADGSSRVPLTDTPFNNAWPVWSPDHQQIAYQTNQD